MQSARIVRLRLGRHT